MNNQYGRKIKRGEVYYIDRKDVEGSEQQAGRPAIIVSNDANNLYSDIVEVVYLTTQDKNPLPTHTTITSTQRESTALCEQICTVSALRLGDYMCKLKPEEMEAVDTCLAISIGLTKVQETVYVDPIEDCSEDEKNYARTAEAELGRIIGELNTELTKAQAERDVYEKLYKDLLEKMMTK